MQGLGLLDRFRDLYSILFLFERTYILYNVVILSSVRSVILEIWFNAYALQNETHGGYLAESKHMTDICHFVCNVSHSTGCMDYNKENG